MIQPGSPVIISLHSPREKLWGILVQIDLAGIQIRGLDINTFDDWITAVMRDEYNIGLTHSFLPMWRVERLLLDESLGDILSLEDTFSMRVGFPLSDYLNPKADLVS